MRGGQLERPARRSTRPEIRFLALPVRIPRIRPIAVPDMPAWKQRPDLPAFRL